MRIKTVETKNLPEDVKERKYSKEDEATIRSWQARLQALARSISGEPDLNVNPGPAGDGFWAMNRQTREVVFDPHEVLDRAGKEDEGVLLGSIAHESGHLLIDDKSFIPDSLAGEIGFASLEAGIEERPTDQVIRDRFPGAGLWVDEMRRKLAEEGELKERAEDVLGYFPQFSRLTSFIPYAEHYTDERRASEDPRTLEQYERIRKTVEEVEHILPSPDKHEEEKIPKAKERFRKVYKEAYPVVKELAEQDRQTELHRQMSLWALEEDRKLNEPPLEDENENTEEQPAASEEPKPESWLSQLPDELRQELISKIQPTAQARAKKFATKHGQELEFDVFSPGDTAAAQKQINQVADYMGGYQKLPVPADTFSEELQDALQQRFEELARQQKEMIEKLIEMMLKQIEDLVHKYFQGVLSENQMPTHADIDDQEAEKERREEEREKKERDEKQAEALREKIRQAQEKTKEKTAYDRYYDEVSDRIEPLYRSLYEIFYPQRKGKRKLKTSGTRPNIKALFNFLSARAAGARDLPAKFWESKETPKQKDYAFVILVDLSSSMFDHPDTVPETFRAIATVVEVLNRLGVKVEVLGFGQIKPEGWDQMSRGERRKHLTGDRIYTLKSFDETLTDQKRADLEKILRPFGGTPTTDGLKAAKESLAKVQAKNKFLLCLTDGDPNNMADAQAQSQDIHENTDVSQIGFGLGHGTKMIESLFPFAKGNLSMGEFAELFPRVIEELIRNPKALDALEEMKNTLPEPGKDEYEDNDPWYDDPDDDRWPIDPQDDDF